MMIYLSDRLSFSPLPHHQRIPNIVNMICSFLAGLHGTRQEEMIDHRLTDREWAEEWKHLDHVRAKCTLTYIIV